MATEEETAQSPGPSRTVTSKANASFPSLTFKKPAIEYCILGKMHCVCVCVEFPLKFLSCPTKHDGLFQIYVKKNELIFFFPFLPLSLCMYVPLPLISVLNILFFLCSQYHIWHSQVVQCKKWIRIHKTVGHHALKLY